MVKNIFILCFIWLLSLPVLSQDLISYVTVNPNMAYIGQPIQLKVSVYTTTWFTSGVDIGNIQVNGALTVYFRSVSNSKIFSGKKYAGVDFYYNLFPTGEGVITIPELKINVESPKEGDYKGIKRTISTKTKSVTVRGVPLGYDPLNWLVARSLNVTEKWSTSLKNVKVGDVIQRTITRSAGGTLAEFIPSTQWDSLRGISIYPKRPQIKTNKSKTGVSSQRVEIVNYLFEKEGEITLPDIEYMYWNSSNKKFYRKKIDSITMNIQPNADLALLASIKKSLQKEEEIIEEDKTFLIFGLTPKEFLKYFISTLLTLYLLFRVLKWIVIFYNLKKKKYILSEPYAFKQVAKAIKRNDYLTFIQKSNGWLLQLDSSLNIPYFVKKYGTKKLEITLNKLNENHFKLPKNGERNLFNVLLNELKKSRNNYIELKKNKVSTFRNNKWLNPTSIN